MGDSANFDVSQGDIIQTIKDSVRTEKIEVIDGDFTTREVFRVPDKPQRPMVEAITVHSLTGFIDYLKQGIDAKTREGLFIHVDSPTSVYAKNAIERNYLKRFVPVAAAADPPHILFNEFVPLEQAIIMLQARFVDGPARADLLKKLGTIDASEDLRQEDDGTTQVVTMQHGIKRSEANIENPVHLQPFRTFTEIEQPASPFIVRLRKGEERGITVALYESDGGNWRNTARLSIKQYLANALPELSVLA